MVLLWFAQQLRQPDGTLDQKTGGPVTVRRSPLFIEQGDQRFLSDLALFPFDYTAQAPMASFACLKFSLFGLFF